MLKTTDVDLFGHATNHRVEFGRDELARCLHAQLSELTLEEFASLLTNRFDSTIAYLELALGKNTGTNISLLYNPHRLNTRAKGQLPIFESLSDEKFADGLARACFFKMSQGVKKEQLLYSSLGAHISGRQYIADFPPYVARDLCQSHGLSRSSRVLDPCAGWGGRMLGASVVVDTYDGCEPSTRTHAGLVKMANEFIALFNPNFQARIERRPYECSTLEKADVPHGLRPPSKYGGYDFALTSPPYYDTEQYSDEETNSSNKYRTLNAWVEGFFKPLVEQTMRRLKPTAAFVLNIGNRKYPLTEILYDLFSERYNITQIQHRSRLSGGAGMSKSLEEAEAFYRITHT